MNSRIKRFKNLAIITMLSVFVASISGIFSFNPVHASEKTKVTVPAGTYFMVRTSEAIDSKRHKAGHRFTVALEADIVVDGTVVAPRGSVIYGQLSSSKQAGRLVGKSEVKLDLTHIMLNNQMHPILTSGIKAVTEQGSGANTVGKTARGAAIGGLINGSDGAKTGAAVGVGIALLTRGGSVNIPQGTLLDFTLAAPFTY